MSCEFVQVHATCDFDSLSKPQEMGNSDSVMPMHTWELGKRHCCTCLCMHVCSFLCKGMVMQIIGPAALAGDINV